MTVRFQDCDPFGHLNNARYIDYFLNARQDQIAMLGICSGGMLSSMVLAHLAAKGDLDLRPPRGVLDEVGPKQGERVHVVLVGRQPHRDLRGGTRHQGVRRRRDRRRVDADGRDRRLGPDPGEQ